MVKLNNCDSQILQQILDKFTFLTPKPINLKQYIYIYVYVYWNFELKYFNYLKYIKELSKLKIITVKIFYR